MLGFHMLHPTSPQSHDRRQQHRNRLADGDSSLTISSWQTSRWAEPNSSALFAFLGKGRAIGFTPHPSMID